MKKAPDGAPGHVAGNGYFAAGAAGASGGFMNICIKLAGSMPMLVGAGACAAGAG